MTNVTGIFHEEHSTKRARADVDGTRYTIWQGHFNFEGELDGNTEGDLLAVRPLDGGPIPVAGIAVYRPTARSIFGAGKKMVAEIAFSFTGVGEEFTGTVVLYGDGVRVDLQIKSNAAQQTYTGTVHRDA